MDALSPDNGYAVLFEGAIAGHDDRAFDARLRNKNPVEWIAMMPRQPFQFFRVPERERQFGEVVGGDRHRKRLADAKTASCLLDRDLEAFEAAANVDDLL